ncbi:hypothetical protein DMENIID0001_000700 [Sergentomyia squamirostris]
MDSMELDQSANTSANTNGEEKQLESENDVKQEEKSIEEEVEIVPFETFDRVKGKWTNWVKRLEVTFDLFKVVDEENRRKMLLYHMGMEAFEVLSDAVAPAEPAKLEYAEIVRHLTQHYDPEGAPAPTEAQHSWRFWQRRQLPAENVETFMEALKELATPCDFSCEHCDTKKRIIRNQFICGLRDPRIRQALLQEQQLTMERSLEVAMKMEELGGEITETFHEVSPWDMGSSSSGATLKRKKIDEPTTVDEYLSGLVLKNCDSCRNPKMKNSGNWHLVRLRSYHVSDWVSVINALKVHGCTGLDVSKNQEFNWKKWSDFSKNIGKLENLEALTLPSTPNNIVQSIFTNCTGLRCLKADVQGLLDFEGIQNLTQLHELKLKTTKWDMLTMDLTPLGQMQSLKVLSIVGVKGLARAHPEALVGLTNLNTLEMGDVSDLPESFFFTKLPKLLQLVRLRLVGAAEQANTTAIVNAVALKMPWLRQLDLVNFELKHGFQEAIAKCTRLQTLLLTPIYATDAAITVATVLHGVSSLHRTLNIFTWVITTELILAADHLASRSRDLIPSVITEEYLPERSIPIMEPTFDPYLQRPRDTIHLRSINDFDRLLNFSMPRTYVRIVQSDFDDAWKVNVSQPNPNQAPNKAPRPLGMGHMMRPKRK